MTLDSQIRVRVGNFAALVSVIKDPVMSRVTSFYLYWYVDANLSSRMSLSPSDFFPF